MFLNSLLFGVISTVQWSGATSICDGIIVIDLIVIYIVVIVVIDVSAVILGGVVVIVL